MRTDHHVVPWVRLAIVSVGAVALAAIAKTTTGSFVPNRPEDALLLQSGLLLVVLGSTLLEPYFTRPAEALVNSLTALVTLMAVFSSVPRVPWMMTAAFLALVLLSSVVCVWLQGRESSLDRITAIAGLAYRISSSLGQARIVYSVVFLTAVAFFVDNQSSLTLSLVAFWALFIAIWPLRLPQFLSGLKRSGSAQIERVGRIDRIDSPGIVRVELDTVDKWRWNSAEPLLVHLHDETVHWGVPLTSEDSGSGRWGTLMLATAAADHRFVEAGLVQRAPRDGSLANATALLCEVTGLADPRLVGFVKEGSTTAMLRFEALPECDFKIGQLVVVPTFAGMVYYQIIQGATHEEAFGGLNYGSHVVTANQVGRLDDSGAFRRFGWLPRMNAPVFLVSSEAPRDSSTLAESLFTLGEIPGTGIPLRGDFVRNLETHTAILGVTGSGKTEFAFDLIRHALSEGIKVVCIDLTSQYADRLHDLSPFELSVSGEIADKLGAKLFDVETGSYGAGAEKKALQAFAGLVRSDVEGRLSEYVKAREGLGLIELREISNTKATLWITEIYLSALLRLARDGAFGDQRVLVVVEEAHTVMPEPGFLGLGDFDSKGTLAKISQIALQGRKYGVGLLVLAQRTATVSKSVLTQCNTVISFSCIDDTSINFLRNVYGSEVAEGLPNLPRLNAIAHGTWIQSEGPIAFEVPYDPAKAERRFLRLKPAAPGSPEDVSGQSSDGASDTADDEPPF